jgi:hypothetical protein
MTQNPIADAVDRLDGEPTPEFVTNVRARLLADLARPAGEPSALPHADPQEITLMPTYTAEREPTTRRRPWLAVVAAAAVLVAVVTFAVTHRGSAHRQGPASVPSSVVVAPITAATAATSAVHSTTVAATTSTLSPTAVRLAFGRAFEGTLARHLSPTIEEYAQLHDLVMALPADQFASQRAAVDQAYHAWAACVAASGTTACVTQATALDAEITGAASAAGD